MTPAAYRDPDSVPDTIEELADEVRGALQSADLSAYEHLLDPAVTWGAPGAAPGCRSRVQVLSWYQIGRDAGVRADVTETSVHGDRILVGMTVHDAAMTGRDAVGADGGDSGEGGEKPRWQVLKVAGGRIVDIRGYDNRDDALHDCESVR